VYENGPHASPPHAPPLPPWPFEQTFQQAFFTFGTVLVLFTRLCARGVRR
jgi:hypothetical protein